MIDGIFAPNEFRQRTRVLDRDDKNPIGGDIQGPEMDLLGQRGALLGARGFPLSLDVLNDAIADNATRIAPNTPLEEYSQAGGIRWFGGFLRILFICSRIVYGGLGDYAHWARLWAWCLLSGKGRWGAIGSDIATGQRRRAIR